MSDHDITSLDELRAIVPEPGEKAWDKEVGHLDEGCREVLAASPFCVLATADADGLCDASPRGGPPGFCAALDDGRLALPDFKGNKRVDSLRNVLSNPHVGLLFLVPGRNETLRINGRASLTTDPAVLEATREGASAPPRLAILVEVETAFVHCSKAPHRAGLWDPASWAEELPDFVAIYAAHRSDPIDPHEEAAGWVAMLKTDL